MRRIIRPKCTTCQRADAVYDSARFKSVMLCHGCMIDFSTYLLTHSNRKWTPLLDEFGHETGNPPLTMHDGTRVKQYFHRAGSNSHAIIFVELPHGPESDIYFPDPLDILN